MISWQHEHILYPITKMSTFFGLLYLPFSYKCNAVSFDQNQYFCFERVHKVKVLSKVFFKTEMKKAEEALFFPNSQEHYFQMSFHVPD